MRVGIAVYCTKCDRRKQPRGRSAPIGSCFCDSDCEGYELNPKVGDLWPGESEKDFGYPCSAIATEEKEKPNEQ